MSIPRKLTEDGREIKLIYNFGYEYHLVESKKRQGGMFPQPCYMGFEGFGLRYCKKVSTYKRNLLNFNR